MAPRGASTPSRKDFRPLGAKIARALLMVLISFLVFTEIALLSPSSLDRAPVGNLVSTEELTDDVDREVTLAPGIPKDRIPEYSIEQFDYVSTHAGQKQWKLLAHKAFLYQSEKLAHNRIVTAYLYDSEGKATVVTGKEAKYYTDQRDLEVYGNVVTRFPDGFETHSEYLRYRPAEKKIEIPVSYPVYGGGTEMDKEGKPSGQQLNFKSQGLFFSMARSEIILPSAAELTMTKPPQPTPSASPSPVVASGKTTPPEDDFTTIESDRCIIFRNKQLAKFTMEPKRPDKERFVRITQPSLFARGRRADLSYGDFDKVLQDLTIYDDVLIKELAGPSAQNSPRPSAAKVASTGNSKDAEPNKPVIRYGTGGRADFDQHKNLIVLRDFPQVYQDNDTITGDIIIVHRDTDLVEVEHSNAFSQGESK